jgi:hypothetical protein
MPASQVEEIFRRLDALESRVNEALQQGQAQPARGSKQGLAEKPQQEHNSTPDTMADKAADVIEDAASDAVQRLHPALIKFLNRWACSWHVAAQAWPRVPRDFGHQSGTEAIRSECQMRMHQSVHAG